MAIIVMAIFFKNKLFSFIYLTVIKISKHSLNGGGLFGKIKPNRVRYFFFYGEVIMANMTDDGQRAQVARKTTLVSVVVNLFLSSAQVLAGVFSGSQGLIADGIHSLSDLVADFVVLLANKKAANHRIAIITTDTGAMKTALHW